MKDMVYKLRRILNRREKLQVLALLVAVVAMAFSQALGIASVLPFISLVMEPNHVYENRLLHWAYEYFSFSSINRFIFFIGVLMLTVIVLSNAISAFATWLKLRFVWMNNHRLSKRLLEKYLSMPYAYFLNQNSADLSKNVLSEVNELTKSYLMPLLSIITRGLMVIFILALLLFIDVIVSVAAILLIGGAYAAIYWQINRNLKKRGAARMRANKMRFKTVNEAFGGIKEIKIMNRESFFIKRYANHSYIHAKLISWNAVIGQLPRYAFETVAFGGIILFVLVLLMSREDISKVIPLAGIFAFSGYRLMPAVQDIFTSLTQMSFNQAILERIYNDLTSKDGRSAKEIIMSSPAGVKPLIFKNEIRLKNVSYQYPKAKLNVLRSVNLNIPYNSTVAFVGPTGAGKTTLADIILGLLLPEEGKLLVDGVPVNKDNVRNWQRNIGYVPQFIYLSDDTVARNIAFGLPDEKIDYGLLEKAAIIADIFDFISDELSDGFDTLVGERGIRLSGGQRQRIGIARALYHDPGVLVFDEATSALDGVTEDVVLKALDNAAKFKTLIIIAHRLTTVKGCDVIYMLDQGAVADKGTYDELLDRNTQFKAMAKIGHI